MMDSILQVLELERDQISRCIQILQKNGPEAQAIQKAVLQIETTLQNKGKVIVTGLGKSGKVGQKIAATLASTGTAAIFLHPTEGLHGDLGVASSGDCLWALSYGGSTEEVLRLLPSLKAREVTVIGMGGNLGSPLARQCDVWIDSSVTQEACPHNLAPTTSTTLALALGDAIAITLMQRRDFDVEKFAHNHPGGSLGRRLTIKIEDIMHKRDDVGSVFPNASMEEVVVAATEANLGGVIVQNSQGELQGIIVEGDIRRALNKKQQFFDLTAQDIMTASPVTVRSSQLASEALQLMENRKGAISVLPVVDEKNRWCGLVRVHDIAQLIS